MKVLVVWENSDEERVAQCVAVVVPRLIGPAVDSVVAELNIHRVPVSARALSWRDLFSPGVTMPDELASYVQALERSVFVEER